MRTSDWVRIISSKKLQDKAAEKKFADARKDLALWLQQAKEAEWKNLVDVQRVFPKAEAVIIGSESYTVFNIRQNRFRLAVKIFYPGRLIYFKLLMTHAEYSMSIWKDQLIQEQTSRERYRRIKKQIERGEETMSEIDPKAYARVMSRKLPQVILTEEENQEFADILEEFTDRGNLTAEEREYVDLVALLIEKFEERYGFPVETTPLDAVRFFMDQHDLKQADMLDVFGSKGIASEILSGKRSLSKAHIDRLSERFAVSPATFFERRKRRKTA